MSGLEFLVRKTLSNPLDATKSSNPENFEEALKEFIDFCEIQLPDIFEIDFVPICFDVSEKENAIVLGGKHGNIGFYDMNTKKMMRDEEICQSSINNIFLALDDTQIIISTSDNIILFLEFTTLIFLHQVNLTSNPISMRLGGNKNQLYCSNYDKEIKIIEMKVNNKSKHSIYKERKIEFNAIICCLDVSDDGSLIALGQIDGSIKLVHGESESSLQSTSVYTCEPTIIAFSEYRKHLAAGFKDFTLKVWNIDTSFTLKYDFSQHTGEITGICFVRDNRYLISGSRDKSIIMWDMKVERLPHTVNLIEEEVLWFKSNDHKKIYFNQNSNCFMMWDVPQLTKNARYRKHTGNVNWVGFLYHSFEILSIGSDGLAVLWDYRNDMMQDFIALEGELINAVVSKQGQFALIASNKPCIYRWNFNYSTQEEYEFGDTICSMRLSSDENMIGIGDSESRVFIYDTEVMERKIIIKGHMGAVTDMCFINDDKILLTASMDATLAKWAVESGKKLETFIGHNRPIMCMIVTPQGLVISASEDKTIIVWNISSILLYTLQVPEAGKNLGLFLSEDAQYLISLQQDKYYYWKMDNHSVIFECDTSMTAACLSVSRDERVIAIAEGNTIFIEENPLKSKSTRIVGKKFGSQQKFMRYVLDSSKPNSKAELSVEYNHWVVTPYLIGASHILSYYNRMNDLNTCLFNDENPGYFFNTINNESPLSLCVEKEYKNCIDVCLRFLKTDYLKRGNKKAYVPLGNCLTKLNTIDIPDIPRLYEILFQKADHDHLPSFCIFEAELPVLYYSDHLIVYPDEIVPKDMYATNGRTIVFYHSLCPLDLDPGTTGSIEFLISLTECSCDLIFRSKILQILLNDKWDRVKWAVYAQGALYILYMFLLSIYCIFLRDSTDFLVFLFINHILLLLYELSQVVTDPIDYWKDMWNLLDQLRGLSFTIYTIMTWAGNDNSDVLLIVIIFSWIRGISYFRMFDGTRYMVRLLSEVLKDMKVFFVILAYSTLAFSFIIFLRNADVNFPASVAISYRLDLGDFDADYTNLFDWLMFFLASVLNPLIMLNLLISIMGDTYSKVKDTNDIANFQELTEMIIEIEKLMFWKKSTTIKYFLHQCSFLSGNETSSDKIFDKIKGFKAQLANIEKTIVYIKDRIVKNDIKNLETEVSAIKRDQEDMGAEFNSILDKNNKVLEDLLYDSNKY